jgi:hypothetical protein
MNPFESALDGTDQIGELEAGPTADDLDAELEEVDRDGHEDTGHGVRLAEITRRWMRLGEHAARLRAVCLDAGLGETLTSSFVGAFLAASQDCASQ